MSEVPAAAELLAIVPRAVAAFTGIAQDRAARAPAAGKWSALEVLGHLIDSAAHNHRRFVCARWQDDLVFAGYDQEAWVQVQAYAAAPWPELVALWAAANRHLARVMAAVPDAVRTRVHARHNLHQVAWQPVRADAPVTLDWFFADYVGHLRHHLQQIDALLGTRAHGA